jgi:hypothetical protein
MMYKQLTSEQRYVISAIRHTLNDKRQPVNSECVNHGHIHRKLNMRPLRGHVRKFIS